MCPSINFIDREQNTTFQDIGAYNGDAFNVTGAVAPEHVRGLDVTDGTLPLLGVQLAEKNLFTGSDDSSGAPQTVLALLFVLATEIRRCIFRDRPTHHA